MKTKSIAIITIAMLFVGGQAVAGSVRIGGGQNAGGAGIAKAKDIGGAKPGGVVKLGGAKVEGAKVEGAKVDGAKVDGAIFEGAKVEGAKVDGANTGGVMKLDGVGGVVDKPKVPIVNDEPALGGVSTDAVVRLRSMPALNADPGPKIAKLLNDGALLKEGDGLMFHNGVIGGRLPGYIPGDPDDEITPQEPDDGLAPREIVDNPRIIENPEGQAKSACDGASKIAIKRVDKMNNVRDIIDALANYTTKYQPQVDNGKKTYCISFNPEGYTRTPIDSAYVDEVLKLQDRLALSLKEDADYDVYVDFGGLSLVSDQAPLDPLFQITNASASHTVTVRNLKISKFMAGMETDGAGTVAIENVLIEGVAKETARSCLALISPNAIVKNVTATKCGDGVLVAGGADKAKITDLVAYDNKVGVHIEQNVIGTDLAHSRIYHNDDGDEKTPQATDGIRQDGGFKPKVMLMKDEKSVLEIPTDGTLPTFYDSTVYFKFEVPEANSLDGRVEFYVSDDGMCDLKPYGQGCSILKDASGKEVEAIQVDASKLVNGVLMRKIPLVDEYYEKKVVVVYTNKELGTSGYSDQFQIKKGFIAFTGGSDGGFVDQTTPVMTSPEGKITGDDGGGSNDNTQHAVLSEEMTSSDSGGTSIVPDAFRSAVSGGCGGQIMPARQVPASMFLILFAPIMLLLSPTVVLGFVRVVRRPRR